MLGRVSFFSRQKSGCVFLATVGLAALFSRSLGLAALFSLLLLSIELD
jgi:hypothetical protein